MKALRFALTALLFSCVVQSMEAMAYNVYGSSAIVYDVANNKVRGYHRTELDYDTADYCTAYVCGSLYKDGVEQVRACGGGFITATINTQFTGVSATSSVISDHYVDMQFFDDEYTSYVDYTGYSFLPGYSYPTDWLFYPANIFAYYNPVSIHLGSTQVQRCGDQRDTIIAEYPQYSVSFTPVCADFTQSGHSANVTFNELNTGDHAWAIVRGRLLTGLECTRSGNGNVQLTLNSAYRCPGRNNTIGGATQSRHMWGDAADIASNAGTGLVLRNAAKNCGACVEPQVDSGSGHVHADWRGPCPPGW